MPSPLEPFYTFSPAFFERIWGGNRIATQCGLAAPKDALIGEAWLLSDHPFCESVVANGPAAGSTLRELVTEYRRPILGRPGQLTRNGRFPLLLKILDAQSVLSVQVHPDDNQAIDLGEDDGGKTEMWYFIDADADSYVTCGVAPDTEADAFKAACESGDVESLLTRHEAVAGQAIHIPAGTVHAIGPGCLIAEIQQNSDVTYRLYDWGRTDADGNSRELHLDNGMSVVDFDAAPQPVVATEIVKENARISPLASCDFFSATRIELSGDYTMSDHHGSPTIILPLDKDVAIRIEDVDTPLPAYHATLVPAATESYTLVGEGAVLLYTLP